MLAKYVINSYESEILKKTADHISKSVDTTDTETIIAFINQEKKSIERKIAALSGHLAQCQGHAPMVPYIIGIPECTNPDLITLILAALSGGKIIKEYDHGVWVKTIESSPTLSNKMDRPSSKDSKKFYLHTDLSYIDTPPSVFMFHCLKNNLDFGGQTVLCNLHTILSKISDAHRLELEKSQFVFPAPDYYGKSKNVVHSIITKDQQNGIMIRYRQDDLYALTKPGVEAIAELRRLIDQNYYFVQLTPNSALFINNQKYLHGRQGYIIQGNKQRFFNQVYLRFN